jgi:hypothetical protein
MSEPPTCQLCSESLTSGTTPFMLDINPTIETPARSPSRSKKDVLRATIVEQLEEARGSCQYIGETCEYALENHPEDMREWLSALQELNMQWTHFYGTKFFSKSSEIRDLHHEIGDRNLRFDNCWHAAVRHQYRLTRCASHKPFLVKLLNATNVKTSKVPR